MDYIYGKLNKEVVTRSYKGGTTDSSQVRIDNTTNTIYVDTQSSIVDTELNIDSTNAVQNKVIAEKFEEVSSEIDEKTGAIVHRLLSYNDQLSNVVDRVSVLADHISSVTDNTAEKINALNERIDTAIEGVDDFITEDILSVKFEPILQSIDNIYVHHNTNATAIQQLKDESKAAATKISSLTKQLHEQDSKHENNFNEIKAELEDLQESVSSNEDLKLIEAKVNKVSTEISDLQKSWQGNANALSTSIKDVDSKITAVENKFYSQLSEQDDAVKDIYGKVAELASASDASSVSIHNALQHIDDLSDAVDTMSTRLKVSENILDDISSDVNSTKANIKEIQKRFNDAEKEHQSIRAEILSTEAELTEDISEVQSLMSEIKEDVSDIKSAQDLTTAKLVNVDSSIKELDREASSLNTNIQRVNNRVDEEALQRQSEIDNLRSEMDDLKFDIDKIPELQSLKDSVQSCADKLKVLSAVRDNDIPVLTALTDDLSSSLTGLRQLVANNQKKHLEDVASIEKDLSALENSLDELTADIQSINSETSAIQSVISILRADIDSSANNIKVVKKTLEDKDKVLQSAISTVDKKYEKFGNRITNLETNLASLLNKPYAKQIEELAEKLSTVEANLVTETTTRRNEDSKIRLSVKELNDNLDEAVERIEATISSNASKQEEINKSVQDVLSTAATQSYINNKLSTIYTNISTLINDTNSIKSQYKKLISDVEQIVAAVESNSNRLLTLSEDVDTMRTTLPAAINDFKESVQENSLKIHRRVSALEESVGEVDLQEDGPLAEQINHLHGHLIVVQAQLEDIQESILDEVREAIDTVAFEGVYVLKNYPLEENRTTLYASTKSGDISLDVNVDPVADNVVKRTAEGNIKILEASNKFSDTDAVHKRYVDSSVKGSVDNLEAYIMSILLERLYIIDGGTTENL